jgi:hypothetical protein
VSTSITVPVKSIKTSGYLQLVQNSIITEGVGIGQNVKKRRIYNDDFFSNLEG